MDNHETQENEILAISSIYGGDTELVKDTQTGYYTIKLKPVYSSSEGDEPSTIEDIQEEDYIHFLFKLPESYPSSSPPIFQIKSSWLLLETHASLLSDYLVGLWSAGEPVLFQMISWIIEQSITYLKDQLPQYYSTLFIKNENGNNNSTESEEGDQLENIEKKSTSNRKNIVASNKPVPTIYTGAHITDKKSKFQAHLAIVHSEEDVELVLNRLYQHKKIAEATHNMYAYRFKLPNGEINEYYNDDGEDGAGDKMLFTLIKNQSEEVLVVVTRWFGGILLGGARYTHIVNVTKDIVKLYNTNSLNTIISPLN